MENHRSRAIRSFSVADAARARVATYLREAYADKNRLLSDLDAWTQALINHENMAKLALVFEADDPAEACYRDLIREIDTEAESGIYLARQGSPFRHLARVVDEPGISGSLYREIDVVAPAVFPDELVHSADDLDLVWVTIEARHDRANIDATVSEIIMSHLLDDADAARDMVNALRALHYAFHEDDVRRRCGIRHARDVRDAHDLVVMVNELRARSGPYEARAEAIRRRAELRLQRLPA